MSSNAQMARTLGLVFVAVVIALAAIFLLVHKMRKGAKMTQTSNRDGGDLEAGLRGRRDVMVPVPVVAAAAVRPQGVPVSSLSPQDGDFENVALGDA